MVRLVKHQSGYSMVEVLMAILILSIAIIPMFKMFDTGLQAVDRSGDYDRARTFANQKLEQAKNLPYDEERANRDNLLETFPMPSGTLETPANGSTITSPSQPAGSEFPDINYQVKKQFVELDASGNVVAASEDMGLIKVTVIATWDGTKTYTIASVVSR